VANYCSNLRAQRRHTTLKPVNIFSNSLLFEDLREVDRGKKTSAKGISTNKKRRKDALIIELDLPARDC